MLAFCAIILSAATAAIAGDAPTKPAPPPPECAALPKGWNCVATKELVIDAAYKIDLEERIALAEARLKARRRFGVHVTCGIGVAAVATTEFDAKLVPAGFCGVGYGW